MQEIVIEGALQTVLPGLLLHKLRQLDGVHGGYRTRLRCRKLLMGSLSGHRPGEGHLTL